MYNFQKHTVFLFLKIDFVLENGVDPVEMPYDVSCGISSWSSLFDKVTV